jgi:hypothetical protein
MINTARTLLLLLLTAGAGCASSPPTVRMAVATRMPAAEGTVMATEGPNENTALEVRVKHLASPEKIRPEATTYVVWARASGAGSPQNLGALQVDEKLQGTLKTVTPLRTFDLFITAEASPTAPAPSDERLLTASIQR